MCLPTDKDMSNAAAAAAADKKKTKMIDDETIPANEKGFKTYNGHTPGKFRKSKALFVWAAGAMGCCAFSLWQIGQAISKHEFNYQGAALVFITAYFLIDVFSGLLHMVLDNPWFAEHPNPLQAPAIGFQEHHLNVNLIGKLSLQQHLSPMAIPVVVVTLLGQWFANNVRSDQDVGCLYSVCSLSVAFFLVLMQMAHRWSHIAKDKRPYGVNTLQDWGILVSAAEHSKHHRPPYESHFCIMSGKMNVLLNPFVRYVLHQNSKLWLPIFFGFLVVPLWAIAYV